MERDLVSVVLTVYNGARWLRQTVDSVLAQTYRPLEVVAVDDGSQDESVSLLASYGQLVRIYSQENCGNVGLVRNASMERARGEYLAFLDQDDWWLPAKLAQQVELMRSDERLGLVHTAVRYFDETTGWECAPLDPNGRPERIAGDCFEELLLANPITSASVLVRRSAVDDVGLCDPRIPGNTVQDYDLWLRIAKKYRCGFLPEPLTVYRMHSAQGYRDRRAMLRAELEVLLRTCEAGSWLADPRRRLRMARLYDSLAVAHYDQGEFAVARRYFRQACQTLPSPRQRLRYSASLLPGWLTGGMLAWKQRLLPLFPPVATSRARKCRFGE